MMSSISLVRKVFLLVYVQVYLDLFCLGISRDEISLLFYNASCQQFSSKVKSNICFANMTHRPPSLNIEVTFAEDIKDMGVMMLLERRYGHNGKLKMPSMSFKVCKILETLMKGSFRWRFDRFFENAVVHLPDKCPFKKDESFTVGSYSPANDMLPQKLKQNIEFGGSIFVREAEKKLFVVHINGVICHSPDKMHCSN